MATKIILAALILAIYCSLPVAEAQTGSWMGPLWVQKVGLVFKGFDQNHNGLHDLQDVDIMVLNYASKGLVNQVQVIADVNAFWAKVYVCALPPLSIPASPLNVAILGKCLSDLGQGGAVLQVGLLCQIFFPLLDYDKNGYLTIDEYTFFFTNFQVPANVIPQAFNTIDANGDGKIYDLPEFTPAWQDYLSTSTPGDKFNNLLGIIDPTLPTINN